MGRADCIWELEANDGPQVITGHEEGTQGCLLPCLQVNGFGTDFQSREQGPSWVSNRSGESIGWSAYETWR
jgi:hypothetical protein